MAILTRIGVFLILAAGFSQAQTVDNPNFSAAIYMHLSAEDFPRKAEASLQASEGYSRFMFLPNAARAALEAGRFATAQAYAWWFVVQTFLGNCRLFWTQPLKIDAWIADVAKGVIPDFQDQLYR